MYAPKCGIIREKSEKTERIMGRKHSFWSKRKVVWLCIAAAFCLLALLALDSRLLVQRYTLETDKLSAPVRLVLVTDLHSCKYGENQQELIRAVEAQQPDLVLLGGDIFDDQLPPENTEVFLQAIAGKYPCYYVAGNHEYWAGKEAFASMMAFMEGCGIRILKGDVAQAEVKGQLLYIFGADDPDAYDSPGLEAQLERMKPAMNENGYTILLSHRPEYYDLYRKYGFDLVLCGHAHGGQWRIPLLINGLYTPDQGLFPRYAGGMYREGECTMIVSRGLARESTGVPRIFNRPELVVAELQ